MKKGIPLYVFLIPVAILVALFLLKLHYDRREQKIIGNIENYIDNKYGDKFIFNDEFVYDYSSEGGYYYTVICGYLENTSRIYFCVTEDRSYDQENGYDEKNPNYYDSKGIVEYVKNKDNKTFIHTDPGIVIYNMAQGSNIDGITTYCGYIKEDLPSKKSVCIKEDLSIPSVPIYTLDD